MGQDNQNQNQSQRNSQTGTQQPGRVNPQQPQRDQNRSSGDSDSQRGKFGDRKTDM